MQGCTRIAKNNPEMPPRKDETVLPWRKYYSFVYLLVSNERASNSRAVIKCRSVAIFYRVMIMVWFTPSNGIRFIALQQESNYINCYFITTT